MRFLLFSAGFLILGWLHFALAARAWRRRRGQPAREIALGYVRLEDYFARSFRSKLIRWRHLPDDGAHNPWFRTIWKGGERLLLAGSTHYPEGGASNEILALDGDFSCGPDCTFLRELYVRRDCQIGKRTRLQAVAADGDLTMGPDATVVRWADASGHVDLRPGTLVLSRVTSERSIRLNLGARALSLAAPEVETYGRSDERIEIGGAPRLGSGVTLLAPSLPAERPDESGFDARRLSRLAPDTWIYQGDLALDEPARFHCRLVVLGSLTCPAGSYFEHDVKATGNLRSGAGTIARGNLVSGGDLELGPGSFFHGSLIAGRNLRLGAHTRGLADPDPVVAYAGHILNAGPNVVVEGKLAARQYVCAVADAPSPPWV